MQMYTTANFPAEFHFATWNLGGGGILPGDSFVPAPSSHLMIRREGGKVHWSSWWQWHQTYTLPLAPGDALAGSRDWLLISLSSFLRLVVTNGVWICFDNSYSQNYCYGPHVIEVYLQEWKTNSILSTGTMSVVRVICNPSWHSAPFCVATWWLSLHSAMTDTQPALLSLHTAPGHPNAGDDVFFM